MLQKIGLSINDTSKLQRKYRLLTTSLGCLIALIGAVFVVLLMFKTRLALGLPLEGGSLEGRRLQFLTWISATLISIPIVFYGCAVIVAGAFGLIMILSGKFTLAEAKAYALYGEYPRYWFQQNA